MISCLKMNSVISEYLANIRFTMYLYYYFNISFIYLFIYWAALGLRSSMVDLLVVQVGYSS